MRWRVCVAFVASAWSECRMSTILNFRRHLERHGLGRKLFERINEDLARKVCC